MHYGSIWEPIGVKQAGMYSQLNSIANGMLYRKHIPLHGPTNTKYIVYSKSTIGYLNKVVHYMCIVIHITLVMEHYFS